MIIVKNINHRRIILTLICLFFALGTAIGLILTLKYSSGLTPAISNTFERAFLSMGKYIFIIWLVGFTSIGIFCVPPACGLCGYSYGVVCAAFLMEDNRGGFLITALKYTLFLVSMFLVASSSSQISLNCYKIHKNPKAALPREREREITEHVIILVLSAIPVLLASLIETYLISI